jgi:hypothetical protein
MAIREWTPMQVGEFLAQIGPNYKSYQQTAVDNSLTGEILLSIVHEQSPEMMTCLFKDAGITTGLHQRVILNAVKKKNNVT